MTFFVWTATLGNILTLNNLIKRHVIVMDWCCMCKKSEKTIDHLLLHCEVARVLWVSIYHLFCLEWAMPQRVVELLASWRNKFESCLNLEAWRLAPVCLMWCI
jgi:hypothetical protein